MVILDNGKRREFPTGAVRDYKEGAGRCDLLPLREFNQIMSFHGDYTDYFIELIDKFKTDGDVKHLIEAYDTMLTNELDWDVEQAMLEVAVHFEEGAVKYGDDNWKKGIPVNVYIDSCIRHYLKYKSGMTDERHDRAVLWNLICCMWTCKNMPELNVYADSEVEK